MDDLVYPEESSAWLSSSESESELDESCEAIAMTPYSRITAHHRQPFSIARKSLLPGHRPPHAPDRELAIHRFLAEIPGEKKNVIPLLGFEVAPNGRIKLDFPLLQTDLKELYRYRKEDIAKEGTIIERFLEVLEALEWIHGLGIIHRDVNPSNILLSEDLREPAFLADFGISWTEDYPDDPDEGIIKYSSGVGTGYSLSRLVNVRPYRAPELIFAPKDYGVEVDMWSFGCTVAELYAPKDTLFSDGAEDGGLSSDLVLLGSIISTLGTPTSETWPESNVSLFKADGSQNF